jgi:hypothetical protein
MEERADGAREDIRVSIEALLWLTPELALSPTKHAAWGSATCTTSGVSEVK